MCSSIQGQPVGTGKLAYLKPQLCHHLCFPESLGSSQPTLTGWWVMQGPRMTLAWGGKDSQVLEERDAAGPRGHLGARG